MKKALPYVLFLLVKFSVAQYCGTSGSFACTPGGLSGPGISDYHNLPCVHDSLYYDQTIQVQLPDTYNYLGYVVQIVSLHIDSITNLPCGLCWQCSDSTLTLYGGQPGCLRISGTTNDVHGAYQLNIYGTLVTNIISIPLTLDNFGYQVFLNVTGANDACTPVDITHLNTSCSNPNAPAPCHFDYQFTSSKAFNCDFDNTMLHILSPSGPGYSYYWTITPIDFYADWRTSTGTDVEVYSSDEYASVNVYDSLTGCYDNAFVPIYQYSGPGSAPRICYTTTDTTLNYPNTQVVFEKDNWFGNMIAYRLWRDDNPNNIIATVDENALGIATDLSPQHPALNLAGIDAAKSYIVNAIPPCPQDDPGVGVNYIPLFTPSIMGADTLGPYMIGGPQPGSSGYPVIFWRNSDPIVYDAVYVFSRYPGGSWRLRFATSNLNDTVWIDQAPDSTQMEYMMGYHITVNCDPSRSADNMAFSNFSPVSVSPDKVTPLDTTGTGTGLHNVSANISAFIYPNPASDRLVVQVSNAPVMGGMQISVHNMLGQLVITQPLETKQLTTLDISTLPAGVYTLSLNSDTQPVLQKKFVKR